MQESDFWKRRLQKPQGRLVRRWMLAGVLILSVLSPITALSAGNNETLLAGANTRHVSPPLPSAPRYQHNLAQETALPVAPAVDPGSLSPATPSITGTSKDPQPAGQSDEELARVKAGNSGAVASPTFDYGFYSNTMRELDRYKHSIYEALSLPGQWSTEVVRDLQKKVSESDRHKGNFESFYLNGAGPDKYMPEYEQARDLLTQTLITSRPSLKVEGRAIWFDRGTIAACDKPECLRDHFKKLADAGVNIIYFETVNAGYPIYPSKLLPSNPLIHGWDPLKTAVEEGHKLGMEVHAWVWAFAVGNQRHNRVTNVSWTFPGPILTHGDMMNEALRFQNGRLLPDSNQFEFWLSPASPKGRAFLKSVYKEILDNYDVDGLQLDYIRYPFQKYRDQAGFEAVGRHRFESETGRSLSKMDDATLKRFIAWKTQQVSSFVQEVSEMVKAQRPGLHLSVAVFPMRRIDRILAIQQDWETWIDRGWIDTISPMSYAKSPDDYYRTIDKLVNNTDNKVMTYPGLALDKVDTLGMLSHMDILRGRGAFGSTLFAMAHLNEQKMEALKNGSYRVMPAIIPHKEPLEGVKLLTEDYLAKLTAQIPQHSHKGAMQYETKPLALSPLEQQQASVKSFLQALSVYKAAQQPNSQSKEALEVTESGTRFIDQAQAWLDSEKAKSSQNSVFFGKLLERVRQLFDFAQRVGKIPLTPGKTLNSGSRAALFEEEAGNDDLPSAATTNPELAQP